MFRLQLCDRKFFAAHCLLNGGCDVGDGDAALVDSEGWTCPSQ